MTEVQKALKFLVVMSSVVFVLSCSKFENVQQEDITEQHSCFNTNEWKDWEDLVDKYRTDTDVLSLYALRVGLCSMIANDKIDADTAVQLFDNAHQIVIEKTRAEERLKGEIDWH